ncbi:hypothetical protein H4F20_08060 [Vibrio sp. 16]|uniref:glycosyl hydrolase family 18 protein n=1 Tax=Vibrio sp. 16 TaxID=391586 RepID=UPI002FF0D5AB
MKNYAALTLAVLTSQAYAQGIEDVTFDINITNSQEHADVTLSQGATTCFETFSPIQLSNSETSSLTLKKDTPGFAFVDIFDSLAESDFSIVYKWSLDECGIDCGLIISGIKALDKLFHDEKYFKCKSTPATTTTVIAENNLKGDWHQKQYWALKHDVSHFHKSLFRDPRVWRAGSVVKPDKSWDVGCTDCKVTYDFKDTFTVHEYRNTFISYASPALVKEVANYVNQNELGGYIFWTLGDDFDVRSSLSLLNTLQTKNKGNGIDYGHLAHHNDNITAINSSKFNLKYCVLDQARPDDKPFDCDSQSSKLYSKVVNSNDSASNHIGDIPELNNQLGHPVYGYVMGTWPGAKVFGCGSAELSEPFTVDVVTDQWGGLVCHMGKTPASVHNKSASDVRISSFDHALTSGSTATQALIANADFSSDKTGIKAKTDSHIIIPEVGKNSYLYAYGNYEGAKMYSCNNGKPMEAGDSITITTADKWGNLKCEVSTEGGNKPRPDVSILPKDKEVAAYWVNWGVYNSKSIPIKPYRIDGSYDQVTGKKASNPEFMEQLKYISTLNYAFMMAIPDDAKTPEAFKKDIGKLYFSDPWADLTKDTKVCKIYPEMCNFANAKNGKPNYDAKWGSAMGNFDAFLELPSRIDGLKLAVSVGGYDRWNAFEVTFGNSLATENFVTSAVTLLDTYKDKGLYGIGLDYENPDMTPEMSQDFLKLVTELNQAFINKGFDPDKQYIDVTVLADPHIMKGDRACTNGGKCGFAPEVLKQLTDLKFVRMLNVMTYDFNGAFNYKADGSGKTGFMTNVRPTHGSGYSIQAVVEALEAQGIKNSKIAVGIPAYGRALSDIDSANHGLGQEIKPTSKVLQGELDAQNCLEDVTTLNKWSCSGTFSYKFITETLLQNGFEAKDVVDSNGKVNGTIAYKEGVWSAYDTLTED